MPQFRLLDQKTFSVFMANQKSISLSKKWVEDLKNDCDPFELLEQLKEDSDDNYEFVGATLIAQVRLKAFKSLFTSSSAKATPKEFIAKIDKLFGRQDLELEELSTEAVIFEVAKNARIFADGRKNAQFNQDQLQKLIKNEYPFTLSAACIELLASTATEIAEVKQKIETLVKIKAPVGDFLEHIATLTKMPFRSEMEHDLKKMSSDHDFVQQLAKQIEVTQSKKDSSIMQISVKDLKIAEKIHNSLLCESDSLACVEFYHVQTENFEKLAQKTKEERDWTYQQLF